MTSFADYAADLRTLADLLDLNASDLPEPKYAEQGLDINIHMAELGDVVQAGHALNAQVSNASGHTVATVTIDTVELRFVYVTPGAMADHEARQAYARSMVTS